MTTRFALSRATDRPDHKGMKKAVDKGSPPAQWGAQSACFGLGFACLFLTVVTPDCPNIPIFSAFDSFRKSRP